MSCVSPPRWARVGRDAVVSAGPLGAVSRAVSIAAHGARARSCPLIIAALGPLVLGGCLAEARDVGAPDGGSTALVDATIADASVDDAGGLRVHAVGYLAPEVHGRELTTGALDCRACHGAELTGGVGPSCDGCHPSGWRTDCTYCHGGTLEQSGAPPRDLRGRTALLEQSFRAHTSHVQADAPNHAPLACVECHAPRADVLTRGHVFDDTPGQAEVSFAEGRSPIGVYDGDGACSSLYCHGSGRVEGAYSHERPTPTCDGCHDGPGNTAGWRGLSGEHSEHLRSGLQCHECHSRTLDAQQTVQNAPLHVNGRVDIDFAAGGVTRVNGTCDGTCHREGHVARGW